MLFRLFFFYCVKQHLAEEISAFFQLMVQLGCVLKKIIFAFRSKMCDLVKLVWGDKNS